MMPQSTDGSSRVASASASDVRHVFVYGTLRRGGRNDIARFAPEPVYVGDARIHGVLYDLGAYPGARLGGDGLVTGEVYRITSEVESQLDVLEEVKDDGSGEYLKREIDVVLDGRPIRCLVYEIHPDRIASLEPMRSGDWMKRH